MGKNPSLFFCFFIFPQQYDAVTCMYYKLMEAHILQVSHEHIMQWFVLVDKWISIKMSFTVRLQLCRLF